MKSYYIGIMSGTSLDAIDAALVCFDQGISLETHLELALPEAIRQEIKALNQPCENDLARSQVLSQQLASLFAQAGKSLLQQQGIDANKIVAIGCHGQTLRHAPEGDFGYSLQIGCGARIAELTGITTVTDFRSRDIAAGGQGAPLVPAFQRVALGSHKENRAIINIGGMANLCYLNKCGQATGFDTGPGNVLLDSWVQKHQQQAFDQQGNWAATGRVQQDLLKQFLQEPYFAKAPPKSTGRELFDQHWLEHFSLSLYRPEDVQATLLELTAHSICQSLQGLAIDAIYLCGGGSANTLLKTRIQALSQKPCNTTKALGADPDYLEAIAFAWLAKRCLEGQSNNCPEATGAKGHRILGAIYPGL